MLSDLFAFLGGELLVFYSIALLASLVLIIQFVLLLFGFDDVHGGDVDFDDGAHFLSLRSLTGFFGGFGWGGVITLENGGSLSMAIGLGFVAGVLLMAAIVFMIRFAYSLKESGTVDFENAIGQIGTVHVSVPPRESGTGQVRVMVQGRFKVVAAHTRSSERIPAGHTVKVSGLLDPLTLLVEPFEGEETEV